MDYHDHLDTPAVSTRFVIKEQFCTTIYTYMARWHQTLQVRY